MPTIKNQETVDLIAHNYCTNGFNKARAMVSAGYSPKYADTGIGLRFVFGNTRVKQAIAAKMKQIMAESEDKIEYIRQLHQAGIALSLEKGDLVNYTRNTEGLGKTYAAYIDRSMDEGSDQQRELDESQKSEAKLLAQLRLRTG